MNRMLSMDSFFDLRHSLQICLDSLKVPRSNGLQALLVPNPFFEINIFVEHKVGLSRLTLSLVRGLELWIDSRRLFWPTPCPLTTPSVPGMRNPFFHGN